VNAAQQMALASALADALEKSGIVVERAKVHRGNLKGWQRIDSGAVAARTIGIWLSWGWSASAEIIVPPTTILPRPGEDSTPSRLRLVEGTVNNDDEDDGA
jgi:hypothetical protein